MARQRLSRHVRPAAVCFDLDGVLIDSMPLHARAWREALAQRGLAVPRRDIYLWEGEPGHVTVSRLLRRAGRTASRQAMQELLIGKERRFKTLALRLSVRPSLARLLTRLAEQVPLALVTGTSRHEVVRVVPRTILRLFSAIVTGDQVRHGKPHPEPYRKAFAALGVRPSRAAVIENAPYGIRSARRANAGWVLALASSLPPPYLREADAIVTTVTALRKAVLKLTAAD